MKAEELYEALQQTLAEGISFNGIIAIGNDKVDLDKAGVVGNIIQEWLQGWLNKRGIEYAPSENTQMPPDFFLNPTDKTQNLLEVKAFNRSASPGFDIAGEY